jgi:hypothetical protein
MVADAYSFVFHNLKPFFALATIPIILTTGLWVVEFAHHGGPYAAALENHDVDAWSYLDSLANEFVWSVFAVGWHRYVLYGFRDTTAATQFYVGHRELRFFFYTVIFLVPYTVAMTFLQAKIFLYFDNPTSAAMYTALLLIILFVFWFRCFLIFPAVAVDCDEGLAVAWAQLVGSSWSLFSALIIILVPLLIFGFALEAADVVFDASAAPGPKTSWGWNIALAVVDGVIDFLLSAVGVTVLSLEFRRKTRWIPPVAP